MSTQTGREVAHRVFATEYNAATHEVSDSDDDRAPNYLIMPTGARVNRLFVIGVLTSVEQVSEQTLRARVADPTGTFVVYAGQYQPDERATLEQIEPPAFVAVTGKANTFTPEGSDDVLTSIRPEAINEVDGDSRDRWVLSTAEHTRNRIAAMAQVLLETTADTTADTSTEITADTGIEQALEAYGTTPGYLAALNDCVTEAIAVVAGQRSEATPVELAPGEQTQAGVDLTALADTSTAETGPAESAPETQTQPAASTTNSDHTTTPPANTAEPSTEANEDQASTDTAEQPTTPETADESTAEQTTEIADFEPDVDEPLYEFDDEERAEIESEHGLEFTTGNDISEPETETDDADEEPQAEDTDMVGAVIDVLQQQDTDDGVKRGTVITAVVEETGASETAVEEAIEEALLSGRCYEPKEDRLKPI